METRLKMRISRMFRSSFGKCRTRNLSDVNENAVSAPQNLPILHMIEPLPSKARPFTTMCKPRCPKTTTQAVNDSIFRRQKAPYVFPPFISANRNGHTCPPASRIFPLDPFYKELGFKEKQKSGSRYGKKKKSKRNSTVHAKSSTNKREIMTHLFSSTSQDSAYFEGSYWFSSEEDGREDESDTLFSSRSLSSDSSSGSHRHHRRSRRKRHGRPSRRRANTKLIGSQVALSMDGKVKDSFAVVKSSSDPYNDFRTSMVEMIVEKQILAAKDLDHLLQCFLSLNSDRHHRTIVAVFTEILETLVSNWH